MATDVISRRPLTSRNSSWARTIVGWLVSAGVTPNAISCASVAFALSAALSLYLFPLSSGIRRTVLLVIIAAGIQLRLLCNLFDGMVAIEGGRRTRSGEIFNELPDRIADTLIFIGAGCAVSGHPFAIELGFLAAILAMFTAHMRTFGGSCGLRQSFAGPMAKQQRMAVMTIAAVASIYEHHFTSQGTVFWLALIVVNTGCVVTLWRRTRNIWNSLEGK
jgi:phosphatidylglycerophosphate synthase